jgi:hypothetical protein
MYLTIAEAAEVSGLSLALLRRLAPRIGFQDGRTWKIPRSVLADSDTLSRLARSPQIAQVRNNEIADGDASYPAFALVKATAGL